MASRKPVAGFIGAGGIAHSHAYDLDAMKHYYHDAPEIEKEAVSSATSSGRESFANRYGFRSSLCPGDFFENGRINSVFILGPNNTHIEHFRKAMMMPSVERIYIEKPLCVSSDEESVIRRIAQERASIKIQAGYQFLFSSAVREALRFWRSGVLGKPVHFDFRYYHGDYLARDYRNRRRTRLMPAPEGGAMADLGSHIISMAIAFIGNNMDVTSAVQAGSFDDVPADSDLFSLITLHDPESGAAGVISASRVSSGTGDMLSFELHAEKGSLKYSSHFPDFFEYYTEDSGIWHKISTGSSYKPVSSFPSGHVPPGWLRALVHAHYVFFTSGESESMLPDLEHGLEVERILRESAGQMRIFRNRVCR